MIEINGNQRARGLVNMMAGVEHSNRAPTTFVELSKTHEHIVLKHDADSLFLDVFVQLLPSICLIGNNTSLNLSLFGKSS